MNEQIEDLLYQALETELGGEKVYEAALRCAQNEELKEEWQKYLDETRNHQRIVLQVFDTLGLDANRQTPGRQVVHHIGESLVSAMEMALQSAPPEAAQLVAAECVVHAETKDHANWELVGTLSEKLKGDEARALKEAYEQVEEQEDMHLYHTMGWSRELWVQYLGLPAVLPPPEEEKQVTTAIGAARAKQSRDEMT
jgi:ferritin-like metal-binding protein YciE